MRVGCDQSPSSGWPAASSAAAASVMSASAWTRAPPWSNAPRCTKVSSSSAWNTVVRSSNRARWRARVAARASASVSGPGGRWAAGGSSAGSSMGMIMVTPSNAAHSAPRDQVVWRMGAPLLRGLWFGRWCAPLRAGSSRRLVHRCRRRQRRVAARRQGERAGDGWSRGRRLADGSASVRPTMLVRRTREVRVERKQAVSLGVRIAVSVGMLVVLVAKVPSFDPADLVPEWSLATAVWLGIAALLTLAGIILSALRWQKVLDALEIRARLPRLMSHYMAGQFVSNVLPTTIGGDRLRGGRLARGTGESPRAFASLVLERLTGW